VLCTVPSIAVPVRYPTISELENGLIVLNNEERNPGEVVVAGAGVADAAMVVVAGIVVTTGVKTPESELKALVVFDIVSLAGPCPNKEEKVSPVVALSVEVMVLL
jgi:hypothetical protein